jgi:hypothetical protein
MDHEREADDYDSPWKGLIEQYFPDFLAWFFPEAHAGIDWARGYEFLDQELEQVTRDAELGRRRVDKLVRVTGREGREDWVWVHIEVQSTRQSEFAERMFVYHYRLFDRYRKPVVSLAVLADAEAGWRPKKWGYARWSCRLVFAFPVAKILDWPRPVGGVGGGPQPVCGGDSGASADAGDAARSGGALSLEMAFAARVV